MTDRTIDWVEGEIRLIDQTRLPTSSTMLRITALDGLIDAIQRLAVHGAQALGVAGGIGVALPPRAPANEAAAARALAAPGGPTDGGEPGPGSDRALARRGGPDRRPGRGAGGP